MGKNAPRKIFEILFWFGASINDHSRGGSEVESALVLNSMCPFTSQNTLLFPKLPFYFSEVSIVSRIALLFSRSVLLFSTSALLFSRSAFLFSRSAFLFSNMRYCFPELSFSEPKLLVFLITSKLLHGSIFFMYFIQVLASMM